MILSANFVKANDLVNDFYHHVNAPMFRRSFRVETSPEKAELTVCGLGFYKLFINGKDITKGMLAPYISAPSDLLYYDNYDVTAFLTKGENVVGIILGNGMHNCPGGMVWDFDKAQWRSSVRFALSFEMDGEEIFCADDAFKTHPSPITFDDLRMGCHYDANLEIPGWNMPGFNDADWENARKAECPAGERKLCTAEPIIVSRKIKAVSVKKCKRGYIYDFGENTAGVTQLKINGKPGQKISIWHGELLADDGDLSIENIIFKYDYAEPIYRKYNQKTVYICKGGLEEFVPDFTYYGFRYALIEGLTEEQATEETLTYLEAHSNLKTRGHFCCSDENMNKLYEMSHRSDLSNFYYFPTDCPHREKNGWTADASVSAEHMLQWLTAENSMREWLHNIRKAQRDDGALPGIVPTGGWGFHWGNGPCWDAVLFNLPYYIYQYTGNKEVILENAAAMMRYLHYATTRLDERGLLAIGLGDWVQPKRAGEEGKPIDAPLELTDSAWVYDMANKACFMFEQVGMTVQARFAEEIAGNMFNAIRNHLIDRISCTAAGDAITSQVFCLALGLFCDTEIPNAKEVLLKQLARDNNHPYVGVIGIRYLLHVLTALGEGELAYKVFAKDTYPGYGQWLKAGYTTLAESFRSDMDPVNMNSANHHFLGDFTSWFLKCVAGLRYNPDGDNTASCDITPCFLKHLSFAEGSFDSSAGEIFVRWERTEKEITLNVSVPEDFTGNIILPEGYLFENGETILPIASGTFKIQ